MRKSLKENRGQLLRAFRENAAITQHTLAGLLHVSEAHLSMLENGQRGRRAAGTIGVIGLADDALRGGSVLEQLWRAAETPLALPASTDWHYNPLEAGGPGWIWLRSAMSNPARVGLHWGVFQGTCVVPPSDDGIFVSFPISVTNPAIEVRFHPGGGWADFGAGVIPAGVAKALELTILAPGELLEEHSPEQHPVDPSRDHSWFEGLNQIVRRLEPLLYGVGIAWALIQPHISVMRPKQPMYALDGRKLGKIRQVGPRELLVSGDQLKMIREARGLSRAAVARHVTLSMPAAPVSVETIDALEHESIRALNGTEQLVPRLDMLYGADGRLGIERTYPPAVLSGHTIRFPTYWRGPIWLQANAANPDTDGWLDLTWGHWRRRQRVTSGVVVTTRKSELNQGSLRVQVPPGWSLTAGIGAVPTALDINRGWTPASSRAAVNLLLDGFTKIRPHLTNTPAQKMRGKGQSTLD